MNLGKKENCIRVILLLLVFLLLPESIVYAEKKESRDRPEIEAKAAVLYCENTGDEVYSKGADLRFVPAEMSKPITALLGLQKLNPEDIIIISDKDIKKEGNNTGLKPGSRVRAEDLISAVLVGGYDDAARAVARVSEANSKENFVNLMNSTARNIGCRNTRFTDPCGKDDDIEKTWITPQDMLEIVKVITAEPTLWGMVEKDPKPIKEIDSGEKFPIKRDDHFGSPGSNGIVFSLVGEDKEKLKSTIFCYSKNGLRFTAIMMGIEDEKIAEDGLKLIEFGEKKVSGDRIVDKDECVGKIRVKRGAKTSISVYTKTAGYAWLPKAASKSLVSRRLETEEIESPVKKGDIVGKYEILVADEVVNSVDVYAGEDVQTGWILSYLGISDRATVIGIAVVGALAVLAIVRKINKARSKKRRKLLRQQKIRMKAAAELQEELERERRGFPK